METGLSSLYISGILIRLIDAILNGLLLGKLNTRPSSCVLFGFFYAVSHKEMWPLPEPIKGEPSARVKREYFRPPGAKNTKGGGGFDLFFLCLRGKEIRKTVSV